MDNNWTDEELQIAFEDGCKYLNFRELKESLIQRRIFQGSKLLNYNVCVHEWDEGYNNVSKCKKCGKFSA